MAAIFIEHTNDIMQLAGRVRHDVVAISTRANQGRGVHQHSIRPVLRQQRGVKSQLPLGHIAIVNAPSVDDRHSPSAIHRASDQGGESLIGVIDLRHLSHIGGVHAVVMDIHRLIHMSLAGSILVAVHAIVRPAVVPRCTHRRRRASAARVIHRVAKIGTG